MSVGSKTLDSRLAATIGYHARRGIKMSRPTIATTTTITTTRGSLKFCAPTTSAACAEPFPKLYLPSIETRASNNQPKPNPTAMKRILAKMPPVPNRSMMFRKFAELQQVEPKYCCDGEGREGHQGKIHERQEYELRIAKWGKDLANGETQADCQHA